MVNIADLARYGNQPKDVTPLITGLFVSKPLVILIGLFTTAAGAKHFGAANWNLWDFYSLVLDHYWGPGTIGIFHHHPGTDPLQSTSLACCPMASC
jgi:NCS1 family nucleobase:cation symporter-1